MTSKRAWSLIASHTIGQRLDDMLVRAVVENTGHEVDVRAWRHTIDVSPPISSQRRANTRPDSRSRAPSTTAGQSTSTPFERWRFISNKIFFHLLATGVTDRWTCLEVGGGLGTITRWLSQRVGPIGYVLTTDIDTRFLETLGLANVEVRRHDIIAGPLPDRTFDLAYARLVLEHLSNPDVALDRMTAAIKPGGWLVVEDFETLPAIPGSEEQADRVSRTTAAMRRVAAGAGADLRLGLSLAKRLRARGLLHVDTEGRMRLCRGNTASARLARLNFEQLREPMLATGHLTIEEFNADITRLDDDDYEWRSPILWTAWGQRPPGELA